MSQFSITDGELEKKALLEANLANEVAITVLDLVELFIQHFKVSWGLLLIYYDIWWNNLLFYVSVLSFLCGLMVTKVEFLFPALACTRSRMPDLRQVMYFVP